MCNVKNEKSKSYKNLLIFLLILVPVLALAVLLIVWLVNNNEGN